MPGQRFRVVQWATGNIGGRALREVIRHPALELVGVLVYDPAKDGVDAGSLCGEEPAGVIATDDRGVHALDADCVLYMPRALRPRRRRRAARSGHERRDDARRALRRRTLARRRGAGASSTRAARQTRRSTRRGAARASSPSAAVRAAVVAAPRRVASRSTSSRTCRGAIRRTCSSSRWASATARLVRPERSALPPRRVPARRSACSPRPRAGRSTSGPCVGEVAAARHATTILAGELPAGYGRRAADHHRRDERRRRGRAVHRELVLHRPTSTRRGTSDRPDGGCGSTATRRSTSTSRSRPARRPRRRSPRRIPRTAPVNAIPYVCAAAPGHPRDGRPAGVPSPVVRRRRVADNLNGAVLARARDARPAQIQEIADWYPSWVGEGNGLIERVVDLTLRHPSRPSLPCSAWPPAKGLSAASRPTFVPVSLPPVRGPSP